MVIQEDGATSLWGTERSSYVAERAANDVQFSLRSINYVIKSLVEKIDQISSDLADVGVPEEYIGQFIAEGFESTRKMMTSLNKPHIYANIIEEE